MTNSPEPKKQEISDEELDDFTGLSRSTFGSNKVEEDIESAPGAMYQQTALLDEGDVSDFEERQTRHTFASSPVTKIVAVTGMVGVVGLLSWTAIHALLDGGGKETGVVEKPKETVKKEVVKDPAADELRAQLALRQQQEQLRELQPEEEEKKPEPTLPKEVKAAPSPKPAPRPRTVRPKVVTTRREVDPAQQWLQASMLGSYGGVSYDPKHQAVPIASAFPKDKNGQVPRGNTVFASHEKVAQVPSQVPAAAFNVKKAISAGTMARAVLTSPVVWSPGVEVSTSFSAQLLEPILTGSGEVAVPAGSPVVLELMQAPESGLVLLAVRSVTLSGQQENIQVNVPTHAIQVRGVGNQPLIAEAIETIPDTSGDVDTLGVITDAAAAAGQIGGIPGVGGITRVYSRFDRANRWRRPYQRNNGVVFQVPAGVEIELFVTQSFGLEQAVSPNSLQLGAPLQQPLPKNRSQKNQSSIPQLELGEPMVQPFQGIDPTQAYDVRGGEITTQPSSPGETLRTSPVRDSKYEELLRQIRQQKHNQFLRRSE